MKFEAIKIHSAPEALAQQIAARIENGELSHGACLPSQRQLAKMFNVGLGTVREAVRILNVMGYLSVVRGKGTYVTGTGGDSQSRPADLGKTLEAVSLADLMKAREIVECQVAAIASKAAEAENIKRLEQITNAMEVSFTDKQQFYDLDFEFHLAVAEAANNDALFEIVKLLVDRAHNHIGFMDDSLSISMPFNVGKAVQTARNVVRHIAEGNGESARQEMYRHLNIVKYELRKEFLGNSD